MIEAKHWGPQRNENAVLTSGDHAERAAVGWAPLRDPSLRSGSLRSAQPTAGSGGITGRLAQGLVS